MIIIPLDIDTTHYSLDVRLDGTVYTLRLDYSERTSNWILSVYLPTGDALTAVVEGLACVAQQPLILGVHEGWTEGQLIIVGDRDPERYDWGTRCKMTYLSAAEVASL